MDNGFLQMLLLLDDSNTDILTIPELKCKGYIMDKFKTALLLAPVFNFGNEESISFKQKKLDLLIVNKAFEFVKKSHEDKVVYLGLVGKKADEACSFVKNDLKDNIIEDDFYKEIRLENQIILPVKKNSLHWQKMKSLSELGVMVISYRTTSTVIFSDGFSIENNQEGIMPFINFVNAFGYFYEEYLIGELFYYVSLIDYSIKDILINNLDSIFVQSICDILSDTNFKHCYDNYNPSDRNFFNDLIGILKTINFNQIRDLKFSFVKDYLYA